MLLIIYGKDIVVVEVGGVAGSPKGVFRSHSNGDSVVRSFHPLDCLGREVYNLEVFFQCLPACGVGGLEGGDVDGEGVVDGVVAQVAGLYPWGVLVFLVERTGGAVQGQVVAAEPEGSRQQRQQAYRHDGNSEETFFLH